VQSAGKSKVMLSRKLHQYEEMHQIVVKINDKEKKALKKLQGR